MYISIFESVFSSWALIIEPWRSTAPVTSFINSLLIVLSINAIDSLTDFSSSSFLASDISSGGFSEKKPLKIM